MQRGDGSLCEVIICGGIEKGPANMGVGVNSSRKDEEPGSVDLPCCRDTFEVAYDSDLAFPDANICVFDDVGSDYVPSVDNEI